MTFQELLKAKDTAIAKRDETAKALKAAEDSVNSAVIVRGAAEEAGALAAKTLTASHKAIHDHLAERGEHYLVDDKGTFTIYRATSVDPGWVAAQPIPGLDPIKKAK